MSDGREAMARPGPRWAANGERVFLAELESVPVARLAGLCAELCANGCRVAALTQLPAADGLPRSGLLVVLADDHRSRVGLAFSALDGARAYPALSAMLPQAQAFERELFEQTGIRPEGHPWLKPLRVHAEFEPGEAGAPRHPFFTVAGPGVHEVGVGPVHAGIIEPGHFRFQCSGEEVLHLEIQLGYQHRGAEALMRSATPARRAVVAESIAGDTAVGHALAHAQLCEALSQVEPPLAAQAIRGIALELERIANHVGDLGALCQDVGFLPGAAWLGRLRGDFLNLLLEISGNRFGRGLVVPGGVAFGVIARREGMLRSIDAAERDLRSIGGAVFDNTSVVARFEHTGTLTHEDAEAIGVVGPVARASECDRDARRDHPAGIYRFAHIPVSITGTGDVMGRALVRWLEAQRSIAFVREQLAELNEGDLRAPVPPFAPNAIAVALVEAWRGEIVHLAVTGRDGALRSYTVVDPSFHNWFGLAIAMRGNQISDFPLCNKSFNLSYAGHDL